MRKIKRTLANIFFLLLIAHPLGAQTNVQKIDLSLKQQSLKAFFEAVESKTDYTFMYNNLNLEQKVSIEVKQAAIADVLNKVLTPLQINYEIVNKRIVLTKNDSRKFTIKGTVINESKEPLIGVNITISSTGKGTITDIDGNFSLDVPQDAVLNVSYIGFVSQQIKVGNKRNFTIVLKEDSKELNEVVVTALGIKRAEKALSYNVQKITSEDLTRVKNANFMNALIGKVAGVTINTSSAGVGGAARVVMRGTKSINYDNNALYVIDGIPVINSGGEINSMYASSTTTDDISSINPEDIESMSVLTGAAAASLYGSLGQNGVVLITTKSGAVGKPRLSYSNSTSFLAPFVLPEFQNRYGQTEMGSFTSWGEKLDTPGSYKPKDFFQTGRSVSHSVTFSTGSETNQTFISASVLTGKGIVPSNNLDRYNFTFKNTAKLLDDKMTVSFNLMYSNQKTQNMFAQGLYHNPLVPVYLFPAGGNWSAIQAYERYDESRNFPTQYWPFADDQFRMQNPYWITNREKFINKKHRFYAGLNLEYKLFDWLKLMGRAKMEYTNGLSETNLYASTNKLFAGASGRYSRGITLTEQYYVDVMANIDKTFNETFGVTGNIGYSFMENKNQGQSVDCYIPYGAIPNLFHTGNAAGEASSLLPTSKNYQALYANAEVSYKQMLYLNASVRSDWWSQLYGTGQLYIVYPSVGMSAILTEAFSDMKSDVLSFLKVRANYTTVGNPPPAFVTGKQTYPVTAGSPDFGNGIKPSLTLQPEKTKGVEAGFNLKMFKNKLSLDFTWYHTRTSNQIFNVPISASSFYSSFYINAGQVTNKGIEATLGYKDKWGDFSWDSNLTFTMNKNRVDKLIDNYYDEESQTYITRDVIEKGGAGSYSMKVAVGGTLGDVYVSTLKMDDQGRYVVVQNGKVMPDDKNVIFAGKAAPDCTLGFNNTFRYKNIDLSFSIYGRFGGIGVSATQAILDAYGVSEQSAKARDLGYVMVNGRKLSSVADYYKTMGNGLNGILSEYVYSATNVRLKNLAIGYTIPGKWLYNKIGSIHLALTGENLFMFYNKAPFDPESTASTGTYYQGIDYFMQPSLKSLGFSVKVNF